MAQQMHCPLRLHTRYQGLPGWFPKDHVEATAPASDGIFRRFTSRRNVKHLGKGHVPVQHAVLPGELLNGQLRCGWHAFRRRVQRGESIVGHGGRRLTGLGPEKGGTPGVSEEVGRGWYWWRGALGRDES